MKNRNFKLLVKSLFLIISLTILISFALKRSPVVGAHNAIITTDITGNYILAGSGLVVLYRVNAGGAELVAADSSSPNWSEDTDGSPSIYRTNGNSASTGDTITLDSSVPASAPMALFQTERWSGMQWDFPVVAGTTVEVRLYLAETAYNSAGLRLFDVEVEGSVPTVYDNIDVYAEIGHDVGIMKSYTVTVSDGNLDINFLSQVDNPALKGIEVIDLSASNVLLVSPSTLNFNFVPTLTTSPSQTVTLTNPSGATQSITVTNVSITGTDVSQFSHNFGGVITLAPNSSTTFNATFGPTSTGSKSAKVEIVHSGSNSPVEIALNGIGVTSYRVNAGGAELVAADSSSPNWSEDTDGNPSTYRTNGNSASTGDTITLDSSVPSSVPMALFQTERWDPGTAGDPVNNEMQWDFPIPTGTMVEVRLYLAEIIYNSAGLRLFDVEVEGSVPTVYDNIDVYAEVGHDVGIMKSYTLTVNDGNLDINLLHQIENSALKGIEVLFVASPGVSITETGGSTIISEDGLIDTYQVVLTSQPVATVTININPDSQSVVAPTTLTFDNATWNITQTVTITAVDDIIVEGAHTSIISHTVSSADSNYNGISVVNVIANVIDSDKSGIVFLPIVMANAGPSSPDLIVEDIIATSSAVQVVIKNQGTGAVPANFENEFWVDLYVNPVPPPTGVNQTCQSGGIICDQFAVWGITQTMLPQLVPQGVITLTVGGPNQYFGDTSMSLSPGTTVYAQVDSDNALTTYGAVQESNEGNNIASKISVAGSLDAVTVEEPFTGQRPPLSIHLPPRSSE